VAGPGGRERPHGPGLGDALVQDLALGVLLVGEHQVPVDGVVGHAPGRVDLEVGEEGVHPEGAGLVGDDGHDPPANVLVAQQVPDQADQGHGGGDLLLARALLELGVQLLGGQLQRARAVDPGRDRPAEGLAALQQVLVQVGVLGGPVVGRVALLQGLVGDVDAEAVAEGVEGAADELLHLVGGVAGLELASQPAALDGLGDDHGGLALVGDRGLVGGMHLDQVVAAAVGGQGDQLLVVEPLDQAPQPLGVEQVLADVGGVLGGQGLELAVGDGVELDHQLAGLVRGQQVVPATAPHDLDDVPARPPEQRLHLLDDLAVAPHRAVEALEVAVEHEGQVVEPLPPGNRQGALGLRLVHLAVADERPHPRPGGVDQLPVLQIVVEASLVDGVEGAEAHGDGRELPEVGHQPRVRVGRQAVGAALLAEGLQVGLGEAALQERPGVDAGGGVALEEDLVAGPALLAPEEVVEADLEQLGRRRVGGHVAAHAQLGPVGPGHDGGRIPADDRQQPPLQLLVARVAGLRRGRDGVEVVAGGQRGQADVQGVGVGQDLAEQEARPARPLALDDVTEGVQPLSGLVGVGVGELVQHPSRGDLLALLVAHRRLPGSGGFVLSNSYLSRRCRPLP
jgi:hypothetical protein